jgi:hypothetical protein
MTFSQLENNVGAVRYVRERETKVYQRSIGLVEVWAAHGGTPLDLADNLVQIVRPLNETNAVLANAETVATRCTGLLGRGNVQKPTHLNIVRVSHERL